MPRAQRQFPAVENSTKPPACRVRALRSAVQIRTLGSRLILSWRSMHTFDLDQFWIDAAPLKAAAVKRPDASRAPAVAAMPETPVSPYTLPATANAAKPEYNFGIYAIAPETFGTRGTKPVEQDAPEGSATARIYSALRPSRSPVSFAVIGFLGGMLAWHALGFGARFSSFVANAPAVSTGPAAALSPAAAPRVETARAAPAAPSLQPASLPSAQSIFNLDPRACMALALDRSSGATRTERCPDEPVPMRDAGRQRRGDLVARARIPESETWSTATAVDATPASAPTASSAGTLKPNDVNLQIQPSGVRVITP